MNTRLRRFTEVGFCALVLQISGHAQVQTVIDPARRIDWSQAGVRGGIPNRATVCRTLTPGAGAREINAAIAACSNGVVQLTAGTFALSAGLTFENRSQVTLRGAGPDQTVLRFTESDPCGGLRANVCIRGASPVWSGNVPAANVRNWVTGFAKGATEITLDSSTGLAVGTILILDQLEDTTDSGGVVISDAPGFTIEGGAPGRPSRPQQQYVEVTAINGRQVTISPGLYMPNWRASQQPQAWWWGPRSATALMNGIEGLTIDNARSTETTAIGFSNAYEGWVKDVASLNANRNHVWLNQAARIEIRNSYFYGTKNAASQSYGVEFFTTSDDLIINNIFHHVTAPIMMGPSAGSVVAFNFLTDMYYSVPTWMMAGLQGSHDAGTGMNLFEGNVANAFIMDLYHGSGSLATLFRNRLTGVEAEKMNTSAGNLWARLRKRLGGSDNESTQTNTSAVNIWAFNRLVNVVGNVLGTAEHHTVYENSRSATSGSPDRAIYVLGYSGVRDQLTPGIPYDSRVIATLVRWGNFDYATRQIHWSASEIPSGISVPSTRTLPPSLFLLAKPEWWASVPWPAIGPDVTGGNDPNGLAHRIPSQVCYEKSLRLGDGRLAFNPERCYAPLNAPQSGRPPTPREPRIIR